MRLTAAVIVAAACALPTEAEEQPAPLVARILPETLFQTGVFGGETTRRQFRIEVPRGEVGRLVWSLSAGERVLARGESAVGPRGAGATSVAVEFPIPPVRDGVVLDAMLTATLLDADRDLAMAEHQSKLRIFGRNPFAQRTVWLKSLDIQLYDPLGDTSAVLAAEGVPFHRVRSADALAEVAHGLVIVGEGISAKSLAPAASNLVNRGISVLWLAPAEGELPIVGLGAERGLPRPDRLVLRDLDRLGDLDDRLDAAAWPMDGTAVRCRLAVQAPQGLCSVGGQQDGWLWLECRYRQPHAAVVVCGLAIVERWEMGPAPRYALARILEYVSKRESVKR
jgi:hypothetical protein